MKITTEDFIKKAKELHPEKNYDYSKVIYKTNREKIEIICPIHGSFFQSPGDHNSLRSPQNCYKCSSHKKSNTEEFIQKAKKIHGDKYDYGKCVYVKSKDKMEIYCKEHKKYFYQNADNHLQGQGCPCGKNERTGLGNKKHNQETFIKASKEKFGDKFDYSLLKYKNIKSKIKLKCKKHDYVFEQIADTHLRSKHCCPVCLKKVEKRYSGKPKKKEEFIAESIAIHGELYDYREIDYKNNDIAVKIFCKKCGVFFWQRPRIHTFAKCGCPNCSCSSGEKAIEKFLKHNKIRFKKQKTFDDCKFSKLLRFDFYLNDYNLLIEYHGGQHYKFVDFFHKTKKEFGLRKKRDEMKKDYANKKNIKFIEIPYWEYKNIEDILSKELL
jgi:hypothetical protein